MRIVRVDHAGVVVGDLQGALAGFRDILGLPVSRFERYGDELDLAFLPCADTQIELIEPLTGSGFTADYLRDNGPGIQHVAFEVDDLKAALSELAARGVTAIGDAPRPGAGKTIIAFLDPRPFGGIVVELCQRLP